MITSVSNAKIKKCHATEPEGKSQKRTGTFCGRRPEDVPGSTGKLGFSGVCL